MSDPHITAALRRPNVRVLLWVRAVLVRALAMLPLLAATPAAWAQASFYEVEPNNIPAEANPVSGELIIIGTMEKNDQDGFLWTVSDDDARKRWTFELQGIPGRLTIAEVVRVQYADNGMEVAATERLMKMGTRDGLTSSIARDLMFEPGEYLIGIAYAGGGGGDEQQGSAFRPPAGKLSFGESGTPDLTDATATPEEAPAGGYRFIIREGSSLYVSKNPGARETRESAQSMRLDREFATFETRASAWYAFSFDGEDTTQRWDIPIQAPVGRELIATLYDETGARLATSTTSGRGHASFPDLAPGATTYYVELATDEPEFIHAIASTAVGQRVTGAEAEPNGEWPLASRIDLAEPVAGRISATNEWDYFRFALDEATTDQLLNLRLDSEPAGEPMEFCLLADDKTRVQCRREKTPIELPDLVLNPGDWGLSVTRAREGIEYRISLSSQGAIEPGMEAEPNDSIEFASNVPANHRVKGRLSTSENDYFRFIVVDEPQLWRFQVIGEDITEIAYYDGSGRQAARIRPTAGQKRMRLENLFLLPGQHFLRVSGRDGGSYTVLARALGPPDPNGELEPNDDVFRMQRLDFGQTRSGLLSDSNDVDYYRFFVANRDHIRLTVQPAADGIIKPRIYWYEAGFAEGIPGGAGEPISMSGVFPPGDYHVSLRATQVSDAEYRLSLERLPRFSCPADCEPNGVSDLYLAAPLPPNRVLEGSSGEWRDTDPYELPVFDESTGLLIRSEQPVKSLSLGINRFSSEPLKYDAAQGGYPATVPAGGPYQLIVDSRGEPYRLALEFADGPGGPLDIAPLEVELTLELAQDRVAAFRASGQSVTGQLVLQNLGDQAAEVSLEAVTSDYRWRVDLERETTSLPAQGRASVPLQVHVPEDAWADRPTRISVRARASDRAQVETWKEISVDREIAPVAPRQSWPVPESLRGGFNVAWSALGSRWLGELPKGNFELIRDNLVFAGARLQCCGEAYGWKDGYRPAVTLELPGSAPVPIAGVALNLFGHGDPFKDIRQATLLLSMDGVEFDEALSFETLPVKTEQYFALPAPVLARFARLRFDADYSVRAGSNSIALGEWKVITEPGFDPTGGTGYNLADMSLGGHLVSDWPHQFYSPTRVLDEDPKGQTLRLRDAPSQDYIIGFHHNRAARIERIEWVYADDVAADRKFERVNVSASLDSAVGPWLPLGEMPIVDIEDTATLLLDTPAWARFVKLTAVKSENQEHVAEPATIRIWEQPTDAEYRSVLTEWGYANPRAWYESQTGLAPEPELTPAGNDARNRAAALLPGQLAGGQVALSRHEHWYRLEVPPDQNTLTLQLTGDPSVRTRIELEEVSGAGLAARRLAAESTTRTHVYEAVVAPGSEVLLRVYEPPRNVVFTWDTSASVNPYLPTIYNALAAFSSQVVPGQEAVNLLPFGRSLLLRDWLGEPYVLQTIMNDYPRRESSSSAEDALKRAAEALAPLAGTKSIVVITDGITVHDGGMWGPMRDVQPRIFGVHVGGTEAWNQDVFEDWARVNGGHYKQLVYQGEMEVAFDRATTMMRRPAGYTLRVESEFREAPGPGQLRVVAGDAGAAAGGAAVELILDASGSMLQRLQGKRRIAVAKEVLTEAVTQHIPAGTPVALRVFGHREVDSCRTDLEIPLAPLDPAKAAKVIDGIQAMNLARTPIADSLAAVGSDLKGAGGRAAIVLVTDGEETCEGDPGKVIEALQAQGVDVHLNIVGFAIDDAELAAQFQSWADLGGGKYFAAQNQQGLSAALAEALQTPFRVYDQAGSVVAEGLVGGEPVALEQGFYRVEAATSPPRVFERVEVPGETETTLTLE